ncbi:helix-turn-helix domain-containing protein [Photobacterium damselae]|uniref:helix-turn-helix domain-containing protein n=1 Tax=Photobacterium damselae TaxID=38293 RepID=UPI001F0A9D43|nr:helix-turn-helix domain-containing protein [Photobacterium damselae]
MLRATKVRIYPTQEQADFLRAQFGAVRFAYNKALHLKSHMYRKHGVKLNPKKILNHCFRLPKNHENITG